MKILKGYTKNLHCHEASIVERYIAEEAIEFFSEYMVKEKPVGVLESCQVYVVLVFMGALRVNSSLDT